LHDQNKPFQLKMAIRAGVCGENGDRPELIPITALSLFAIPGLRLRIPR